MKRREFIRAGVGFTACAALRAPAPVPVVLALALKCVAVAVIAGTAIILYRCRPKYYLCWLRADGEPDFYYASCATVRTLATTGARRCQGPWNSMDEPAKRAGVDNAMIELGLEPPYQCGPLGDVPDPTSVPIQVTLHQSNDGGLSFSAVASADAMSDGNCAFGAFFTANGTTGMSKSQAQQMADCETLLPGIVPASAFFRMSYEAV